jgi:hypothetical protein
VQKKREQQPGLHAVWELMFEMHKDGGNSTEKTAPCHTKKNSEMKGRPSTFTEEHDSFLIKLIDNDPQIIVSDIMEMLIVEFEGFSISNSQLNHHLKNDLCLTMKKATLEAEARNSPENLQERFDWFMKWKDSDLDFTRNCVFIDEAGFHVNM